MFTKSTLLALAASGALTATASPIDLAERAACPQVHVFGARETTAAPGLGSSATVVNGIVSAHSGATSEVIDYPACGGDASCGGVSYPNSVKQGTQAVVSQVSAFAKNCPNTKIVMVGYSQGAEIIDTVLCGNGDPKQGVQSTGSIAGYNIAAAIFMGDPRYETGAPYNVGTCKAGGFSSRPAGQTCGNYNSKVKSYCDAADPYCCNGNDANTHNGYAQEYGQQAISFVNGLL